MQVVAESLRQEGRTPVIVLHGMPGVGKTALAREICHTVEEYYADGIIWLDMQQFSVDTALEALAIYSRADDVVGLPAYRKVPSVRSALLGWRVLIVLDGVDEGENVDRLVDILLGSPLLITTRVVPPINPNWTQVAVKPLQRQHTASLLLTTSGVDSHDPEQLRTANVPLRAV